MQQVGLICCAFAEQKMRCSLGPRAPPLYGVQQVLVAALLFLSVLWHPTNGERKTLCHFHAKTIFIARFFVPIPAAVTYVSPVLLTVERSTGVTEPLVATSDIPGGNITYQLESVNLLSASPFTSINGSMLIINAGVPQATFFVTVCEFLCICI